MIVYLGSLNERPPTIVGWVNKLFEQSFFFFFHNDHVEKKQKYFVSIKLSYELISGERKIPLFDYLYNCYALVIFKKKKYSKAKVIVPINDIFP